MNKDERNPAPPSAGSIFLIFLRLGLTSFGGPVAHLGYFRTEFVEKRAWLRDRDYADLVALCQFMPGPASSQVGLALGHSQRGKTGAFMAWAGFTLPSALALALAGWLMLSLGDLASSPAAIGAIAGLKIAAVAVVAQAVGGMGRSLAPDGPRASIALLSAALLLAVPALVGRLYPDALASIGPGLLFPLLQVLIILAGGLAGILLPSLRDAPGEGNKPEASDGGLQGSLRSGIFWLGLFAAALFLLPFLTGLTGSDALALFDRFFRSGSLVFGGGHVVLPLLDAEMVRGGHVQEDVFLAGYGLAQAVPGPLFTFSAWLGMTAETEPNGFAGAALALAGMFVPSFLLVFGLLPFQHRLKQWQWARQALKGINAAVVGMLVAALYDPVWTAVADLPFAAPAALICFAALLFWKLPPWALAGLAALAGGFLGGLAGGGAA